MFSVAMAQEPKLNIYTDRSVYQSGESGIIFMELNTYGLIKDAEIEVVILSPENIIINGVIIYTEIPEKIIINKDIWQTEQIILREGLEFLHEEKTIMRSIDFTIPEAAPTGDYRIIAKATYIGGVLEQTGVIAIIGQGVVDAIIVIYIIIIFIVILAIIYSRTSYKRKKR
jgi:hypothetical protein